MEKLLSPVMTYLELVQMDAVHLRRVTRNFLGQYAGSVMRMTLAGIPGAGRLQRRAADISPDAKRRLKWIGWYHGRGNNTCPSLVA